MRRIVLDGAFASLGAVYDRLARELGFPGHFGRNLDALWDVMTVDVEGPVEIVWRDHAAARRALGRDFDRLVEVLREVEGERPDFRLRLE